MTIDLAGVWALTEWQHATSDGVVTWPYTTAAAGRILYAVGGIMGGFLMHPGWAAGSAGGALAGGFLSYSGRYSIDGDVVSHHVDMASQPSWVGIVLRRQIALAGDRLVLTSVEPPGMGVHRLGFVRG